MLFENDTNKMVGPPVALIDSSTHESKHSGGEPPAMNSDSTLTGQFLSELLAAALIAAGSTVVEVGTPLFLEWWSERAWPAIKLRWSKRRSETSDTVDSAEDSNFERVAVRDDEVVSSTPS
ncbi:hypothetical protein P9139_04200 [Curtobacterium flaccumfaciens]|nr:hypothetical protein P9139_04200 [Curtobacterium flaccumfaciens]